MLHNAMNTNRPQPSPLAASLSQNKTPTSPSELLSRLNSQNNAANQHNPSQSLNTQFNYALADQNIPSSPSNGSRGPKRQQYFVQPAAHSPQAVHIANFDPLPYDDSDSDAPPPPPVGTTPQNQQQGQFLQFQGYDFGLVDSSDAPPIPPLPPVTPYPSGGDQIPVLEGYFGSEGDNGDDGDVEDVVVHGGNNNTNNNQKQVQVNNIQPSSKTPKTPRREGEFYAFDYNSDDENLRNTQQSSTKVPFAADLELSLSNSQHSDIGSQQSLNVPPNTKLPSIPSNVQCIPHTSSNDSLPSPPPLTPGSQQTNTQIDYYYYPTTPESSIPSPPTPLSSYSPQFQSQFVQNSDDVPPPLPPLPPMSPIMTNNTHISDNLSSSSEVLALMAESDDELPPPPITPRSSDQQQNLALGGFPTDQNSQYQQQQQQQQLQYDEPISPLPSNPPPHNEKKIRALPALKLSGGYDTTRILHTNDPPPIPEPIQDDVLSPLMYETSNDIPEPPSTPNRPSRPSAWSLLSTPRQATIPSSPPPDIPPLPTTMTSPSISIHSSYTPPQHHPLTPLSPQSSQGFNLGKPPPSPSYSMPPPPHQQHSSYPPPPPPQPNGYPPPPSDDRRVLSPQPSSRVGDTSAFFTRLNSPGVSSQSGPQSGGFSPVPLSSSTPNALFDTSPSSPTNSNKPVADLTSLGKLTVHQPATPTTAPRSPPPFIAVTKKNKKAQTPSGPVEVQEVRRVAHFSFDPETGQYSDIPPEWRLELSKKFGVPLPLCATLAVDGYPGRIPPVLTFLKKWLIEHDGLEQVGIFRLAPEASEVQNVKIALNNNNFHACNDVNVMAHLIKVWFRELPVGLLDYIKDKNSFLNLPDTAQAVGEFIETQYEEPQLSLWYWLLDLCNDIADNSTVNKMGIPNVGIVIAPNLYQPPEISDGALAMRLCKRYTSFCEKAIQWRLSEVGKEKRPRGY
jgi:hypothetical protein